MHRHAFDLAGVDTGMYTDVSVHRVYLFCMVCLQRRRPADQDSSRHHPCRMHRDTFDYAKADSGMYTADNYRNNPLHATLFCMSRVYSKI